MSRLTELESLGAELTEALQGDVRDFFVAMFRHRLGRIEEAQDVLKVLLPEVMVNPVLREHYYRHFVLRIASRIERYVQARIENGDMRAVDPALAARVVQGMFVGLLFADSGG